MRGVDGQDTGLVPHHLDNFLIGHTPHYGIKLLRLTDNKASWMEGTGNIEDCKEDINNNTAL